jgi:cytochrome c553
MSTKQEPLPAEPQDNAANKGVAAELSDEAIRNLTGFFDVLIQMDFAQKQRNERNDEDGSDLPNTPKVAA